MNEKSKRALGILSDIAVIIVILFAVAITVMAFSSRESGVPKLFGRSFMSVQSDSMSGTMEVGDLIIVEDCNPDTLQEDDVVTFWKYSNEGKFLNTHRIIERIETKFESYDQIVITYKTKGDHNVEADMDILPTRDIVGRWTGKKIPHLGSVMDFLGSPKGFLICIVVPLALLFAYQLYKFIVTLIDSRKDKAMEEIAVKTEEEKQRVIEEYLESQKQQDVKTAEAAAQAIQVNQAQTAAPPEQEKKEEPEPIKPEEKSESEQAENQEKHGE